MLRLSKKAEYALMALKDLASRPEPEAASAREIAERYGIPVELMAKVLQRLTKTDLLASHHGTHGGYLLARPASRISVADVIEAIDGPIMVTSCTTADDECDQYATCNIRDWSCIHAQPNRWRPRQLLRILHRDSDGYLIHALK